MYSCPTLEKSAVQPKTTSLCSSITVITLWCERSVSTVGEVNQYIRELINLPFDDEKNFQD